MKRRVSCALLALCLLLALLPMTAGAADVKELNLANGYIHIRPNEYVVGNGQPKDAAEKYIISTNGTLDTEYNITIGDFGGEGGTYYVTLKNLSARSSGNATPLLRILENSTVYLTIEGTNQLDMRGAQDPAAGISVYPGAKLYISGGGSLTVTSKGDPAILGQNTCEIHISGEKTTVHAYATNNRNYKPFAIQQSPYDGSNPANLTVSVTDGAALWAYGGIRCKELKLDDTASLWSQAWADNSDALDCANIEYRSDRGICLYYYRPQPIYYSLPSTFDQSGSAYKILDSSVPNPPTCAWELQGGMLYGDGKLLCYNITPMRFNSSEMESTMGSWALLNGKPVETPPVTPVQEPEGNLLQNIIGSGLFFVPEDFPFYDVNSNDWFYDAVKSAWENELIDGVTARYFKPDSTLTVAQAIKLAAALYQKQSVGFVTLQNGGTHWYDNYVNYAVANNLIEAAYQGKSAETMNAPVTRAEFVHILAKLLNAGTINTVNNIPDVKSGDAYAEEIFAFYCAGILTGSDRLGTFHPESSLKRSEAAAILVRLYDASQRQYITLR